MFYEREIDYWDWSYLIEGQLDASGCIKYGLSGMEKISVSDLSIGDWVNQKMNDGVYQVQ